MSLLTLIQKSWIQTLATATSATVATPESKRPGTVAEVATVAVAIPPRIEVANIVTNQPVSAPGDSSRQSVVSDALNSWEWIEERAAILECEAGVNREEANYRAFMLWYRRFVS